MPGTRSTPVETLLYSAAELRGLERWEALELTLSQALSAAVTDAQSRAVLDDVMRVPQGIRAGSARWQTLTVWAWCVNRFPGKILAFVQEIKALGLELSPEARLYRAWAQVREAQAEEALTLLDQLWPTLPPQALGFAWRTRAQALAALGRTGWQLAFQTASQLLLGRRRSLCLAEYGHELDQNGLGVEAREAWREALAGFDRDVFHQAWLRFNLGVSAFRDGAPEAEHHFLKLTQLARLGPARPFASRAWTGLGTFRRLHGEWERAEEAYRRAARSAGEDSEDAVQAWRGTGHVRRLQGLPEASLEDFGRAVAFSGEREHWIHVDVATVWAQLGQAGRARQELALAGGLEGVDLQRAALVRAEVARLGGDEAGALTELAALALGAPWAREERSCFPALFGLAERANFQTPSPAPPPPAMRVEVRAAGVLDVRVNGRPVSLTPTGRPAELLVALLEQGGAASVEALVEMLYPGRGQNERGPRKQVSELARSLRQTLGWSGSVVSKRGTYQLDPDVHWNYDVAALRAAGLPLPAFLEGQYSEWVRERQPTG